MTIGSSRPTLTPAPGGQHRTATGGKCSADCPVDVGAERWALETGTDRTTRVLVRTRYSEFQSQRLLHQPFPPAGAWGPIAKLPIPTGDAVACAEGLGCFSVFGGVSGDGPSRSANDQCTGPALGRFALAAHTVPLASHEAHAMV